MRSAALLAFLFLVVLAAWPGNAQIPTAVDDTVGTTLSALDPLTFGEEALAIRAADQSDDVALLREGETRVIGASVHTPDVKLEGLVHDRLAEVQIYRYDTHDTILAVVNLTTGDLAAPPTVEMFEPILVREELLDARAAFVTDPEVLAAAGGLTLDLELINAFLVRTEVGPCSMDRCVQTQFVHAALTAAGGAGDLVDDTVPGESDVVILSEEAWQPLPGLWGIYNLRTRTVEDVFTMEGA